MQELCNVYGITKSRTTPYHPAGNGGVERFNQTLLNLLRSLDGERRDRWSEHLPELVHAYNNTPHSATGYAPAFLMFGRHLRRPVDVNLGLQPTQQRLPVGDWVKEHQRRMNTAYRTASQRMGGLAGQRKRTYDRRAGVPPLLPGERVWTRNRNRQGQGKLASWWDPEPFIVLGTVGEAGVVYRIRPERGGRERTIHRNALKLCVAPPSVAVTQEPVSEPNVVMPVIQQCYGFYPEPRRRSSRSNLGQPPVRYSPA